jgi:hypothetical protein
MINQSKDRDLGVPIKVGDQRQIDIQTIYNSLLCQLMQLMKKEFRYQNKKQEEHHLVNKRKADQDQSNRLLIIKRLLLCSLKDL